MRKIFEAELQAVGDDLTRMAGHDPGIGSP